MRRLGSSTAYLRLRRWTGLPSYFRFKQPSETKFLSSSGQENLRLSKEKSSKSNSKVPVVIIVGGSYGGLSLALFLDSIGIKSVIFTDDSLSYENDGLGGNDNLDFSQKKQGHYVGLWSNCLRCLRAIDINLTTPSLEHRQKYFTRSTSGICAPPSYSYMTKSGYLSQKGNLLASPKTPLKEGDLLFIRHRDILMSLYEHCKNRSENIKILQNRLVVRIEEGHSEGKEEGEGKDSGEITNISSDQVAVLCGDGERYFGDFIVGADGMFSTVRDALTSNSVIPSKRGYFVYRGLSLIEKSDVHNIEFFDKFSFQSWGYQQRFAAVQLQTNKEDKVNEDDGKLYYMWFATIANYANSIYDKDSKKQDILDLLDKNSSDDKIREHLLRYFPVETWHNPIQEILKNAYDITAEDAFSIAQKDILGRGFESKPNITVVGDAAHGLDPILAQGAGVAIEDAYILTKALATTLSMEKKLSAKKEKAVAFIDSYKWKDGIAEAFRMYEKGREERIRLLNYISDISQYLGAHHSASFSFVRDLFFILSPTTIKGQIFDYFIKLSLAKSIWIGIQPFQVEKLIRRKDSAN